MNKKNIISLSGDPASGKGAVSKILMKNLNFGIYRNGEYFRKLASSMNMSLEDFGEYVKDHPEIDREIENSAKKYAKEHDNFIIDARLGWYAVPESFKVYLKVDIDEAARRAFNDESRKVVESFSSESKYKEALIKRFNEENERYFNLYNVRKENLDNYDLVIDTTNITPEEVALIIENEYKKWLNL